QSAVAKYKKAFSLDADVANHPIDFTLIGDVIWIQSDVCPVPVPALAQTDAAAAPDTLVGPKLDYPVPINREVRSQGNVTPRGWIGAYGKVSRLSTVAPSRG